MTYHFHAHLFGHPFSCTWEHAAAALEQLPRMIFEADGSWIWSGNDATGSRWQIDGHLFDFEDRLYRVELRGGCPPETFDQLLSCFGWPETQVSFELVREGTRFSEGEFRDSMADLTGEGEEKGSPSPRGDFGD